MVARPFLKWAGGKRWLVDRDRFSIPTYSGTYFEPFIGGGAVYFYHAPERAVISDINSRLIDLYVAIRDQWQEVYKILKMHQKMHSKDYYYKQRSIKEVDSICKAAQFLYLNRACWNGLYRENLKGEFNVPIGTKSKIIFENDDFERVSALLKSSNILCCDFEITIDLAKDGDLVFVDPPYTVSHNFNGFVKYNEKIFSWSDQIRLRDCVKRAIERGVNIIMTNADHDSIRGLYDGILKIDELERYSVISGLAASRRSTKELLLRSNSK